MESKILKNIIPLLISAASVGLFCNPVKACMFSEEPEIYRIAMFRAETKGMNSFSQFYYSADYLPENCANSSAFDWNRNCLEWQKQLNGKPIISDIYSVLYKIPADMFVYAWQEKILDDAFESNTFVEELLKPQNKAYLKYMLVAKAAEYHENNNFDPWETGENSDDFVFTNTLINRINIALAKEENEFLKKRYAFQLSRLYSENMYWSDCISLYDTYFTADSDSSIVESWALLFKALALDGTNKHIEANYLYSKIFARSDEKKLRCYLAFNNTGDAIAKTLLLTKNNTEKIDVIALSCFHNPGPALEKLKEIYALDHNSNFLAPLIMREINKLEDWIITPELTAESPAVAKDTSYSQYYFKNEASWENAKLKNRLKDLQYLRNLISFLANVQTTSKGDLYDFIAVAIAHLYLIDDKPEQSKIYLAQVSEGASKSILFQKYIDGLLISIKSDDISNAQVKENIGTQLSYIQKSAKNENSLYKTLYSIVLKLSKKYDLLGDIAMAGLLTNKSDELKYFYNSNSEYGYMYSYYMEALLYNYNNIAFFDEKANPKDMDSVIRIISKPINSLDSFAISQKLSSINAYKDLKGTLAFRMDSLTLAYKTFDEIPESYYKSQDCFQSNLNEDPFVPKSWPHQRNFKYKFSKLKFVKQLLALKKQAKSTTTNSAEAYLKLGNAYFNCTYWGNSWMMFSYFWSIYPSSYRYWEILHLNDFSKNKSNQLVYYECTQAMEYYQKAFNSSNNKEVKAKALFMMQLCDNNAYYFRKKGYSWDAPADLMKKYPSKYYRELCLKYSNTKAFDELSSNCSSLYDYASALGINMSN